MKPESSSPNLVTDNLDEWEIIDNAVEEQRQLINISYSNQLKEVTLGIVAAVLLFMFIVSAFYIVQRTLHHEKATATNGNELQRNSNDGVLYEVICSVDRINS